MKIGLSVSLTSLWVLHTTKLGKRNVLHAIARLVALRMSVTCLKSLTNWWQLHLSNQGKEILKKKKTGLGSDERNPLQTGGKSHFSKGVGKKSIIHQWALTFQNIG